MKMCLERRSHVYRMDVHQFGDFAERQRLRKTLVQNLAHSAKPSRFAVIPPLALAASLRHYLQNQTFDRKPRSVVRRLKLVIQLERQCRPGPAVKFHRAFQIDRVIFHPRQPRPSDLYVERPHLAVIEFLRMLFARRVKCKGERAADSPPCTVRLCVAAPSHQAKVTLFMRMLRDPCARAIAGFIQQKLPYLPAAQYLPEEFPPPQSHPLLSPHFSFIKVPFALILTLRAQPLLVLFLPGRSARPSTNGINKVARTT